MIVYPFLSNPTLSNYLSHFKFQTKSQIQVNSQKHLLGIQGENRLPRENEEDDGAGSGATGDEAFTAAKASGDAVEDGLAEEQEGEGGKAVNGGSVGGVNAESSVVVLIGDHFCLKNGKRGTRFQSQIAERE